MEVNRPMKKEALISFRVPSEVYDQVVALARERKQTISAFMKDTLTASTWKIELRRNRVYHRELLKSLNEIEKKMKQSEKKRKVLSP